MVFDTKMFFDELPYYLTVIKGYDNYNGVIVKVESRIHVNGSIICPISWTTEFVKARPEQFRLDVLSWIVRIYDLKLTAQRYE